MMKRFVCIVCGHVVKTDGTDYRAPCPKCRNYMVQTIEPSGDKDVFVTHSDVKPNSHNFGGPQPRYRAVGEERD